jgi:hypothetical protein
MQQAFVWHMVEATISETTDTYNIASQRFTAQFTGWQLPPALFYGKRKEYKDAGMWQQWWMALQVLCHYRLIATSCPASTGSAHVALLQYCHALDAVLWCAGNKIPATTTNETLPAIEEDIAAGTMHACRSLLCRVDAVADVAVGVTRTWCQTAKRSNTLQQMHAQHTQTKMFTCRSRRYGRGGRISGTR